MSNSAALCSFNFSFPQSSLAFNTCLDLVGQMWSSLYNIFLPIVQRKFYLMLTQSFKFCLRMLCTAVCSGANDPFLFCFKVNSFLQFYCALSGMILLLRYRQLWDFFFVRLVLFLNHCDKQLFDHQCFLLISFHLSFPLPFVFWA